MSEIAERIAGNGNAALVRLGIAVSSGVSLLLVSIISWNASGALKKLDDTHDKVIQIQTQFDGQVQLYTELRATRDHEISDLHLTQQSITRALGEIERRVDRLEEHMPRPSAPMGSQDRGRQ